MKVGTSGASFFFPNLEIFLFLITMLPVWAVLLLTPKPLMLSMAKATRLLDGGRRSVDSQEL
jgi:hypothetical protein